jgi:hypothetical protein
MKQKVIKFFQNLPEAPHEQFNTAFALYSESEGKNVLLERSYNAKGCTTSSLENLLYDLQKLHGITDVEKSLLAPEGGIAEVVKKVAELEEENEELQSEKEDLEIENEELKEEIETLKLAPKLDAKQIRVEFPFLNDKDCPDEFKILIADKITAWNSYLTIQESIRESEIGPVHQSKEVLAILAKEAIEAFNENKLIYDELNCYQTTGKVLGVHPIFKKLRLSREVEEMTADELIKYKGSSAKYFSVKKTALAKAKKAKDESKVSEIEAAVAERHDKLFLVNKKLGVAP